jgi:hypothetical protein
MTILSLQLLYGLCNVRDDKFVDFSYYFLPKILPKSIPILSGKEKRKREEKEEK